MALCFCKSMLAISAEVSCPETCQVAYSYDGGSKLFRVSGSVQYLYEPDGSRVATVSGGSVAGEYLDSMDGTLTTELASNGTLVRGLLCGGGRHLADCTSGTGAGGGKAEFHLADEVNSLIDTIDQTGSAVEACASSPFGEGLNCSPSVDCNEKHFADSKRDQETNFDYLGARYYSSTLAGS